MPPKWSSEQLGLMEAVPVHGRGGGSNPTQTFSESAARGKTVALNSSRLVLGKGADALMPQVSPVTHLISNVDVEC